MQLEALQNRLCEYESQEVSFKDVESSRMVLEKRLRDEIHQLQGQIADEVLAREAAAEAMAILTHTEKELQRKVQTMEAEVQMLKSEICVLKTNENRLLARIQELEELLEAEKFENTKLSKDLKSKDDEKV